MDYQSLHIKTVVELKKLAKVMEVRVPAGANKAAIIDRLLEADQARPSIQSKAQEAPAKGEAARDEQKSVPEAVEGASAAPEAKPERPRRGRPPKARANADQSSEPETSAEAKRRGRPKQAKATDDAEPLKQPDQAQMEASKAEEIPESAGEVFTSRETEAASPQNEKAETAAQPAKADVEVAGAEQAPARENAKVQKATQPAKAPAERAGVAAQSAEKTPQPDVSGAAAMNQAQPPYAGGAARTFQDRRGLARPIQPERIVVNRGDQAGSFRNNANRGFQPRQGFEGQNRQSYEGQNRPAQRVQGGRFVQRSDNMPGRENPQPRSPMPEQAASAEAQQRPLQQEQPYESASARGRREGYYNAEYKTSNPAVPEMLAAGECNDGAGVLEIQQDGYGFLRAENCLPGPNDVYISIAQIRRFNLRMGDYVEGKTRPQREGDRYSAMLYITSVNGAPPEEAANRPRFEDLVPIYPDERLRLEAPSPQGRGDFSLRLVDMLAPIGKGQRGMIVSQPKAGKTTLLKKVANAITANYPDIKLIVLLIDERPEEVTDMKRSIDGEVIYSTFDEEPEHHVRVSEMVLERAQRLTEMGRDVVVLMDSITRLARAYNLVITPTGRSLSGGLDPGALFKPKRFFGAARNIENGGSLTVIATALVETGSRMDDIIFEEFKGTGNMELHLDRKLSDKRVFPAIDMLRSGTRREELLLTEAELDGEMLVRRVLSGGRSQEMAEQLIDLMSKTATNAEFFEKLKGWIGVFEKDGFSLGGK